MLLGGGGSATNNDSPQLSVLNQSFPLNTNTWRAVGVVVGNLSTGRRMTVQAWAVCTV